MRPNPPVQEEREYRLTPEERREVAAEVRKLRPQTSYVSPMREAFTAARVTPDSSPQLVNRVLRVMKRNARRSA